MSVGLVIIAHDGIGPCLLGTASLVLGECPLEARVLSTALDSDPEELLDQLRGVITELEHGDGVLILTDLPGSTPSNVARRAAAEFRARIVSGLNLSMLINVLNYPGLDLDGLAARALEGGRAGIIDAGAG
jgi:PTS system mannose-specific IIA component